MRRAPREPDPRIEKHTALRREQKADDYAEAEERDGIFFLQTDAGDHAEPQPVARAVFRKRALDGEDSEVSAAHPEIRFEAVGAEQASVREILRRNDDGDGTKKNGEAASAEFAGEDGGLNDQKGGRECGNEANAAERVSQDGAADVNQKRNERRLVDVSPGEMIAAGDVIELVAKVAVAVVEVDVEEEFREGDGPDEG